MNTILKKEMLAANIVKMIVESPEIAGKRKAGQFIMLKIDEDGERIPLTIADADPVRGTVTLIAQVVGKTTSRLAAMEEGQSLMDFAGPLGKPTHIEKVGHVVCVGGGIGVAPMHPIAQAFKAAGNKVTGILGARTKSLFIMEAEMQKACDEVVIVSDDGTHGAKGFVTDALKRIIESNVKVDLVVAIGPPIMMKMVSLLTKSYNIRTLVSLNTIMIDGTGMCGGCRVLVGGKVQFVCVDGPEFDGHLVDFDGMMNRLSMYRDQEKASQEAHSCKLGN